MQNAGTIPATITGLCMLAVVSTVACGKMTKSKSATAVGEMTSGTSATTGSGNGTTAAMGFLTSSDLAAPSVVLKQDAATAVTELETDASVIYDNQPPSKSAEDCMSSAIDALKVQSTDTVYEVNDTADVTSCVQSLSPSTGGYTYTIQNAKLQVFMYVSCPQGGLGKISGAKTSDLGNPEAGCSGTATLMNEVKLVTAGNYSGTGGSGTVQQTSVSWYSGPNLTPASVTVSASTLVFAPGVNSGSLFTKVQTPNGAVASTSHDYIATTLQSSMTLANDTKTVFPSAGLMSTQVNGWQGTITFSADAPPGYELSPLVGMTGSLTKGTITPLTSDGTAPTSLALTAPGPALPKIRLPRFGH